jgi:hypothetical protein
MSFNNLKLEVTNTTLDEILERNALAPFNFDLASNHHLDRIDFLVLGRLYAQASDGEKRETFTPVQY